MSLRTTKSCRDHATQTSWGLAFRIAHWYFVAIWSQERTNVHFSDVHLVLCQFVGIWARWASRLPHPSLPCLTTPTTSVASVLSAVQCAVTSTKDGLAMQRNQRAKCTFERCSFCHALMIAVRIAVNHIPSFETSRCHLQSHGPCNFQWLLSRSERFCFGGCFGDLKRWEANPDKSHPKLSFGL